MSYPLHTKTVSGHVDGVPTTASINNFSDKILITITQEGRLAQWIQVPMTTSPSQQETYLPSTSEQDDTLLPLPHLTARTLLGGSTPDREATGQLFAVQIASAIATRNPAETRSVLVGLGMKNAATPSREAFFDMMELVVQCF